MIQVKNLSIEYRQKLFDNISFILGNKDKVGLVGLNGSGKTTLLRILMGIEVPDNGSVSIINERVEYLPQEYSFPSNMMVGELLESLVEDHRTEMYKVDKILSKLNFKVDIFQDINTLSEGQKMKLYLTKLLINNPTVLLLDEPTNHLDIEGITWFESFINSFQGICVIISHDREFLNNTVNKIFEIDERQLYVFEGNYNDYIEGKKEFVEERAKRYYLQEKHREKLENLIERISLHSSGEKQSRALSAARSRLNREVERKEINEYKEQKIKNLTLKGEVHKTKTVLNIKNINFAYNQNTLLENANLTIWGQDKLWMYGPNGIGKTSLIKLITGELKVISGEIKLGENIKWTYFSQDQSHLEMDSTLEDYFLKYTNVSYSESFSVLDNFLFPKEIRKQKIHKLSPGQRARLSFAVFSRGEYDFLILDEPTNHLDIKSKEVIEESLKEFKGTILLISHDRYFVNQIGINRKITIKNKKIVEDKF